jgi:uncharacterized protein YigE (DUF2233 family)
VTRAFALFVLLLTACGEATPARPDACMAQAFDGERFNVCRYDPAAQDLRLIYADDAAAPLRSFSALEAHLGEKSARVAFAMNAGMYNDAGKPIGLYIEDGRTLRKVNTRKGGGNFHMKPNGVFWIDTDASAHVSETSAYVAANPNPIWATQSGPMLVINGALHPQISPNGESRNIRNGVGVTKDGAVVFAISETPVSFGALARLFRDELACPNALYFDGSVSSLWAPQAQRMDSVAALGPMVVISWRAPQTKDR